MRNYCFNRFTLRTDNIEARRKVLRWLALNYRLYEYPIEKRGSRPVYRTQAFPSGCISSSDPNDSQRRDIVSTDRVHGFVHTRSGGLRLFGRRVACPSALTLRLRISGAAVVSRKIYELF